MTVGLSVVCAYETVQTRQRSTMKQKDRRYLMSNITRGSVGSNNNQIATDYLRKL
ncbi:hypothetical protein [Tateyamaria omphalii]|uniref:hypothetical protein n=1 Tax=Tateyamaria omphalii TaxID=299262 RepID=UPI0012FA7929|nr:hypothetical protein [Tateyamaria omphalii]